MSVESTRRTMTTYVDALNGVGDVPALLGDDCVFSAVGTDQEARGRDAVAQTIEYFHRGAFDATVEVRNLVVAEDRAAAELTFNAKHIGEFAGIPATGKTVSIPFAVFYELDGDKVTSIGAYQLLGELIRQLSET